MDSNTIFTGAVFIVLIWFIYTTRQKDRKKNNIIPTTSDEAIIHMMYLQRKMLKVQTIGFIVLGVLLFIRVYPQLRLLFLGY